MIRLDVFKAWDDVRSSGDIVQLTNFAVKYPNSASAKEACKRIRELINSGGLKTADLSNDISFIGTVLTHKDETLPTFTPILDNIARTHDLENKYPLGFAIFYINGKEIVNFGEQKQSGNITFDPAIITVRFNEKTVCLDKLPLRINGQIMSNITDICFSGNGSVMHAVQFDHLAALDIEPLGSSKDGLA